MMSNSQALLTIKDGEVPETRIRNAAHAQDFARRLLHNDSNRARKRALVNGIVDGNPPYKTAALRNAGRADACNVNWGIAKSYMDAAGGAFYDLFSEAPGAVQVTTEYGEDEERKIQYSRIMSREVDRILADDPVWDYNVQISQWDMVLHGCGPMIFEDEFGVLPRAFPAGDLKVPERTRADTYYWESGVVFAEYYPPQLYEFIRNEEAATARGWDVEYVKLVIQYAMDVYDQHGNLYSWEFYQQELKNNAMAYYDDTRVCKLAHLFWKEFSGKISHAIVERETTVGHNKQQGVAQETESVKFLFKKEERYDRWDQCVHPMYYDRGNGGFHHSVTGLGVKMYSAMEYQNRLLCNLADKAFSPKILFKPTTADATNKFQLARFGDFAVTPFGFEFAQTGVAGLMNDGLAMNQELTGLVSQNLATYRQGPMKQSGNPVTARQVMYDASQISSLSKTQFNRYYRQLDSVYTEVVNRLCNPNSPDERAKDFQKRCKDAGVPAQCFKRIEKVQAVRVVGQGSPFMRRESIDSLMPIIGSLPEEGRDNLLCDKISAEAGASAVSRYYPRRMADKLATDQQAEATQWVGSMKVGVPPVITSTQNPLTYSSTFMAAATQAVQSIQQGANPTEVFAFLQVIGPAILAHLQRMGADPSRKEVLKQLYSQWQTLAKMTDQIGQMIQQQQQQSQEQAQKTQATLTDEQLKAAKVQNDIQLKTLKTQAQLKQSAERHQQGLALADAKTATELQLARARAQAEQTEPAGE